MLWQGDSRGSLPLQFLGGSVNGGKVEIRHLSTASPLCSFGRGA